MSWRPSVSSRVHDGSTQRPARFRRPCPAPRQTGGPLTVTVRPAAQPRRRWSTDRSAAIRTPLAGYAVDFGAVQPACASRPKPIQLREGELAVEVLDVVLDVEDEAAVVAPVQRSP